MGELSQLSRGAFITRFLERLPPHLADSFTEDQLTAVERAFGMRYAVAHKIDIRRAVRLFGRKFYLVVLVGRERQGDALPPRRLLPYGVAVAAVSAAVLLLT